MARWVVAAAVVVAVAAGAVAVWNAGPPASTPPAGRPVATLDAGTALDRLAALDTVSGWSDAPYDRDLFGQRWLDVDRNGCDTRNDILGRDLRDPVFKPGTRDCKVLSGTLIDPYDGQRVDFVSGLDTSVLVQIDHVVPLAWAWRHGAERWSDDRRAQFANDPRNLRAASQKTNQDKQAAGPSEWLPPARELRCGYAQTWAEVLDAYSLGVNAADRAAAEAVLRSC
ncbi:MAG: HNH endonuclease family protein [Microbacterium sp.]|uniref:HNH endonuclease family protein n=1 Tax=Microbacterium sp. TaxID=51671 RepID=UPI0039E5D1ED